MKRAFKASRRRTGPRFPSVGPGSAAGAGFGSRNPTARRINARTKHVARCGPGTAVRPVRAEACFVCKRPARVASARLERPSVSRFRTVRAASRSAASPIDTIPAGQDVSPSVRITGNDPPCPVSIHAACNMVTPVPRQRIDLVKSPSVPASHMIGDHAAIIPVVVFEAMSMWIPVVLVKIVQDEVSREGVAGIEERIGHPAVQVVVVPGGG